MINKQKLSEYFEVFYHPNEFISQFKYAFDSLADSIFLIKKEYPNFLPVLQEKARYPFVTIKHRKSSKEEFSLLYFSMTKQLPQLSVVFERIFREAV
jgi:hypothetical protein